MVELKVSGKEKDRRNNNWPSGRDATRAAAEGHGRRGWGRQGGQGQGDHDDDSDDDNDNDDQVIAAEGERDASESLKEAAKVIQRSPQALQVNLYSQHSFDSNQDILVAVSADS